MAIKSRLSCPSLTVLTLALTLSATAQTVTDASAGVKVLRTPQGGLQPQAALDQRGALHLVYFLGEPGGGDLYYVRRAPGKTEFSAPIRVNSEPNTAVATGTIRGAQMAIGKNNRIHVAWNGPHKGGGQEAPMYYTRLDDRGAAFEPQRNVMQFSGGLDGGGSVAADALGHVYVAWHGRGVQPGEEYRRVWLARSTNEGRTFARETSAWEEPTGACGCCGMRAFSDRKGRAHLLYRSAGARTHRDMYLLSAAGPGQPFTGVRLDTWEINACPMSSATLIDAPDDHILAAWETAGQVSFAQINPAAAHKFTPVSAPGATGKRRHPSLAVNQDGQTLLAWTEGTGWKKGGALAWQLYNANGHPVGDPGAAPDVPVWSFAAVVPEKNGGFTIIY
ncbi:MAG: hypothetical protein ACKV2V_15535 [Blastocatellia bacterium]